MTFLFAPESCRSESPPLRPFITGTVMVDAIRQPPFEIGPLPPTPVTLRPWQNRPSAAQTWPLSAIPGMGMPQSAEARCNVSSQGSIHDCAWRVFR